MAAAGKKAVNHTEGPKEVLEAAPAAGGSGEGCGSCPGQMKRLIPEIYRTEVVELFKLAGPVMVSQFMIFMISFISAVFCGHLGKTEFAGVSLAVAVINVTGICIGVGLSITFDTLISQTYGSGNLKRVGVILQRGILILLLACFPCWAVLINTEPLLLGFRQNPEVASLTQLYVKIFMPALPASFMYQLQGRYLQNQGIIWPQVITGIFGNIANAIFNYILLFQLDLGVAGSAAANSISQYVLATVLFIYICLRGLHKATWGGWSLDSLQEWGLFIKLAIPSMLMLCLEWWIFEAGGFLAGLISETELGAQSVTYQLSLMIYMIPFGISAAASVRVGNALGAGDPKKAKLSAKLSIVCGFIIACFLGGTIFITRNVIGYIFTSEQDIIRRVSPVLIVFSFTHICDATAGVTGGVVRGAGIQLIGALCTLIGHYFISTPVGVSLMFAAHMGIVGLWIGITIGVFVQATFFMTFLIRLDWEKASAEALVRAGVQKKEETEMEKMENMDTNQNQNHLSVESAEEICIPDQNKSPVLTVGEALPVRQLVLRRGLTFLLMIVILIAGIVISDILVRILK